MSMLLNAVHNHQLGGTGPCRPRLSGDCHNVHNRHVNHLRGVAASLVIGPSGCLSKSSWSRRFIFGTSPYKTRGSRYPGSASIAREFGLSIR